MWQFGLARHCHTLHRTPASPSTHSTQTRKPHTPPKLPRESLSTAATAGGAGAAAHVRLTGALDARAGGPGGGFDVAGGPVGEGGHDARAAEGGVVGGNAGEVIEVVVGLVDFVGRRGGAIGPVFV